MSPPMNKQIFFLVSLWNGKRIKNLSTTNGFSETLKTVWYFNVGYECAGCREESVANNTHYVVYKLVTSTVTYLMVGHGAVREKYWSGSLNFWVFRLFEDELILISQIDSRSHKRVAAWPKKKYSWVTEFVKLKCESVSI